MTIRYRYARSQSGAVLVVGLILLIVLTLMGISAINVSTLNLRNVRNMQYRQTVLNVAQEAIETVMSSSASFTSPTAQTITVPTLQGNYSVTVAAPICTGSALQVGSQLGGALKVSGGSAGLSIEDTYWDVKATLTDQQTGAKTEIHQGVMVPLVGGCS